MKHLLAHLPGWANVLRDTLHEGGFGASFNVKMFKAAHQFTIKHSWKQMYKSATTLD